MGAKRTFKPPTLEEVIEYCASRNNQIDPYKFYDFYDVSGWIDSNGKPVRSWKQKVITWEGRGNNGNKSIPSNAQSRTVAAPKQWNIHYDN